MSDLKFAAIGAGFWARFQLSAWKELPGAQCVALCDRTLPKAENLARELGIPSAYDNPEEMLRREKLDFVEIITDPWSHLQLVHLVAAHKIPVICQKPMAPTLAESEEMVATCRQAGVPFFIHENWRWQAPIRELKKKLDAGDIGTPFRARISCVSGFPVFSHEPWLKNWPEYILLDMGPHLLDVARFLFGEAQSLYCQINRIHKDIKGEDVATCMLKMGGRTTVTIELAFAENYLEHDDFLGTPIFVEGDQGTAELAFDSWLRITTKSGTHARRIASPLYSWALPGFEVCHASMVPCNANLLQALRGDGPAETPGEDNLKTTKLVFAAYDSARSGSVMQFAEDHKTTEI